jgi:uncharacterized protein (TIGR01777 family)
MNKNGMQFHRLIRRKEKLTTDSSFWDPANEILEPQSCENFDIVIHLSGENIGSGRWTDKRKQSIKDSRTKSTSLLSRTLAGLENPPQLFICASGVSFYGDRAGDSLTEESEKGEGFVADVVQEWEEATSAAKNAGIRTINSRFGVVLSPQGGLLARLLPIFKLGFGGKIGDGQQYMPWISLRELPHLFRFFIENEQLSGVINAVAPEAVTNKYFTQTLATVLKRPAVFTVPALALRLVYGQMADEMILSSEKVVPAKLNTYGYQFTDSNLNDALKSMII